MYYPYEFIKNAKILSIPKFIKPPINPYYSPISELPIELILLIFYNLPQPIIKHVRILKLVCKHWRDILLNIQTKDDIIKNSLTNNIYIKKLPICTLNIESDKLVSLLFNHQSCKINGMIFKHSNLFHGICNLTPIYNPYIKIIRHYYIGNFSSDILIKTDSCGKILFKAKIIYTQTLKSYPYTLELSNISKIYLYDYNRKRHYICY
jgi:hypothetical protein